MQTVMEVINCLSNCSEICKAEVVLKILPTLWNSWTVINCGFSRKTFQTLATRHQTKMGTKVRRSFCLWTVFCAPSWHVILEGLGYGIFPANCTGELQLYDLGILHNFKLHYCRVLCNMPYTNFLIRHWKKNEIKIYILQVTFFYNL